MKKETHELIENKIKERARAKYNNTVKSHTNLLRKIFKDNKAKAGQLIEEEFENAILYVESCLGAILIPNLIDKETKDILAKIDQILAD